MTLKGQLMAMKTVEFMDMVTNDLTAEKVQRAVGEVEKKMRGEKRVGRIFSTEILLVISTHPNKRTACFWAAIWEIFYTLLAKLEVSPTEKVRMETLLKKHGKRIFLPPLKDMDGPEGYDELCGLVGNKDGGEVFRLLWWLAGNSRAVEEGKTRPNFVEKNMNKDDATRIYDAACGHLAALYSLIRVSD